MKKVEARNLDEVSRLCRASEFATSKLLPDGKFLVELMEEGEESGSDPRTVFVARDVSNDQKLAALDQLIESAGLFDLLTDKCQKQGKTPDQCKILIKTNLSPTVQKEHKSYTDPEIVDHLADVLESRGFSVEIFETETMFLTFSPAFSPEILSTRLDPPFRHPVRNLSAGPRQTVKWKKGETYVSQELVNADVVINAAKLKTQGEQWFSVALKNMFGSLPHRDKMRQYHYKHSGFDVEDATILANHATPVDFVVVDGVVALDGNIRGVYKRIADEFFDARTLFVGRDPLAIDKLLSIKMGMEENKSAVVRRMAEFRGDFEIASRPDLVVVKDMTPEGLCDVEDPDAKFERFVEPSGKVWRPTTAWHHWKEQTLNFRLPRAFRMTDNLMNRMMGGYLYTVLTDEEKRKACGQTS
jgi:uncharacterized protein (DUF362 family)